MISFFICSVLLIFSECSDLSVLTALTTKCLVSCVDSQIGDGWCDSPWCDGCESFTTDGIFDGDDCMFDLSEVAVGKEAPEEVAVGIACDTIRYGATGCPQFNTCCGDTCWFLGSLGNCADVQTEGELQVGQLSSGTSLPAPPQAYNPFGTPSLGTLSTLNAAPTAPLTGTKGVLAGIKSAKSLETLPGLLDLTETALAALVEKAKQKGKKVENSVSASYLLSAEEKAVAAQNEKLRRTNKLLVNALREMETDVGTMENYKNCLPWPFCD